jgi:hypothetical protein
MSIAETFDTGRFYLGDICPNGHEFEASGFSLRYHSNKICVVCRRQSARKWYCKNPEKVRQSRREWKRKNPEKVMEENRAKVLSLSNYYVSNQLLQKSGIPKDKVTPELIELKREQLTLHRNIKTLKEREKNNGLI